MLRWVFTIIAERVFGILGTIVIIVMIRRQLKERERVKKEKKMVRNRISCS